MGRMPTTWWSRATDLGDLWQIISAPGPWVSALVGLPLLALALLLGRLWRRDSAVRGARVITQDPLRRFWGYFRASSGGLLTLAGRPLTHLDETKHFKLIGTTGTGKTTAIRELLSAALVRNDRAVIADPDGGYCARFFDPWRGDRILNPFQSQSARWEPLTELMDMADPEQLASALIASSADASANEWRGYARAFVSAVLERCRDIPGCESGELWRLIAVAGTEELRPLLAGTPAQPFLDPENARMFGSLRAIAVSAMRPLDFVQWQKGRPFSVRHWVRAGRGVLFIPYSARQIAALRTLIATWMGLAIYEALSQKEDVDQRLWLVVDELDALGAIAGLKDALTRLRKFGGRCVLGFQSVSQVSATYGADAHTIIENCGNTLILRCSGSENGGTSQYAARLIGDREVIRRQRSRGRDNPGGLFSAGARRSVQFSEQRLVEPAVLAAQVEQLADLAGYLKIASSPTWQSVRIGR
jgi:type IV secretory pathway TraG/TraD family ATPase VirD4